jgi:hypothetical protein
MTAGGLPGRLFQLPRAAVAAAVQDAGLIRTAVEGWDDTAWIHPAAAAVLAPVITAIYHVQTAGQVAVAAVRADRRFLPGWSQQRR